MNVIWGKVIMFGLALILCVTNPSTIQRLYTRCTRCTRKLYTMCTRGFFPRRSYTAYTEEHSTNPARRPPLRSVIQINPFTGVSAVRPTITITKETYDQLVLQSRNLSYQISAMREECLDIVRQREELDALLTRKRSQIEHVDSSRKNQLEQECLKARSQRNQLNTRIQQLCATYLDKNLTKSSIDIQIADYRAPA